MTRTSNDQRSDAHNKGSREQQANEGNRRDQLNPDHEAYDKARAGNQQQQQEQQRQQGGDGK